MKRARKHMEDSVVNERCQRYGMELNPANHDLIAADLLDDLVGSQNLKLQIVELSLKLEKAEVERAKQVAESEHVLRLEMLKQANQHALQLEQLKFEKAQVEHALELEKAQKALLAHQLADRMRTYVVTA